MSGGLGVTSMTDQLTVWVFNGPRRYPGFPSAVFSDLESAEKWIQDNKATGTLTEYPVNIGV